MYIYIYIFYIFYSVLAKSHLEVASLWVPTYTNTPNPTTIAVINTDAKKKKRTLTASKWYKDTNPTAEPERNRFGLQPTELHHPQSNSWKTIYFKSGISWNLNQTGVHQYYQPKQCYSYQGNLSKSPFALLDPPQKNGNFHDPCLKTSVFTRLLLLGYKRLVLVLIIPENLQNFQVFRTT